MDANNQTYVKPTGGKMKQELKLGRPVIAWSNGAFEYKGTFISQDTHGDNWVLENGDDTPRCFKHVKIDPTAEPMNGDEVEGSNYKDRCFDRFRYIGQRSGGLHCVEANGIQVVREHVRFPQSKRDRVRELLESDLFSVDTIIDQIDYIYRDES